MSLDIVPGVPNHINLEKLFSAVKDGSVALPIFQRSYVWSREEKCLLLKSLCAELSIGSFILWKPETNQPFKPILHYESNNPQYLILDGQQRLSFLSSLYFSAKAGTTNVDFDEYFIEFSENKSFGFDICSIKTEKSHVERVANTLNKINVQRLIDKGVTELGAKIPLDQKEKLTTLLSRITGAINVYSINKHRPEALYLYQTCNMAGKQLKQIDLTEAVLSNQWEDLMIQITKLSENLNDNGAYKIFNNENILRCLSSAITHNYAQYDSGLLDIFSPKAKILKNGNYIKQALTEKHVKSEFKLIKKILHDLKSILSHDLHFKSSQSMTLPSLIVSSFIFRKYHSEILGSEIKFKAQFLKWYIFNILFNHYTGGGTNLKVNQDISDILRGETFSSVLEKLMKNILINSSEEKIEFMESHFGLIGESADIYAGVTFDNSKLKVIKQMMYTLACHNNAIDWYSSFEVKDFDRLEVHHIFPKSKFQNTTFEYFNKLINHVSNLAYITGPSNRKISNKLAEDYLWNLSQDHVGSKELLNQGIKIGTKKNELNREKFLDFCRKRAKRLTKDFNGFIDWLDSGMPSKKGCDFEMDMINEGENNEVEFKSSFSFDYTYFKESGQKRSNKDIEFEIVKTINAFANSRGGYLFIGVSDDGEILGLKNDLEILNKSFDELQRQITQKVKIAFKNFTPDKIVLYTRDILGKKIIIIRALIAPSHPNEKIKLSNKLRKMLCINSSQEISFKRLGSSSGKQKYEIKQIVT